MHADAKVAAPQASMEVHLSLCRLTNTRETEKENYGSAALIIEDRIISQL